MEIDFIKLGIFLVFSYAILLTYNERRKNEKFRVESQLKLEEFKVENQIELEKLKLLFPDFKVSKQKLLDFHLLPILDIIGRSTSSSCASDVKNSKYIEEIEIEVRKLEKFKLLNQSLLSYDNKIMPQLKIIEEKLSLLIETINIDSNKTTDIAVCINETIQEISKS